MTGIRYVIIFCCICVCSSVAGGVNIFCWIKNRTTVMIGSTLK